MIWINLQSQKKNKSPISKNKQNKVQIMLNNGKLSEIFKEELKEFCKELI